MKRLLRKSDDLNKEKAEIQVEEVKDNQDLSGLIKLDQLSEADVRHERCPQCNYNPLERKDGFKVCPRCEAVYKILDGTAYQVAQ